MAIFSSSPELMAEYTELKAEQRERIKIREQLYFIAFALYGGLAAYAFTNTNVVDIWLVLSFVAIIVGHLFFENEVKISSVRVFLIEEYGDVLKWESAVDTESFRGIRKFVQFVMDAISFSVPAFLGLFLSKSSQLTVLPDISRTILFWLAIYLFVRTAGRYVVKYLIR